MGCNPDLITENKIAWFWKETFGELREKLIETNQLCFCLSVAMLQKFPKNKIFPVFFKKIIQCVEMGGKPKL